MSYNIPRWIKRQIDIRRREIAAAIDDAVGLSFANAHRICRGRDGEVDKVLQFFIDGVDLIENHLDHLLLPVGIEVSVASIFTHQSPYVKFSTAQAPNSRCELADICFLATYGETLDSPAGGLGNALLLQAKQKFSAPPKDRQRQLYEVASKFKYDCPTTLKKELPDQRTLPPKHVTALCYWELDRLDHVPNAPTGLRWSHSPSKSEPFGSVIADFLAGECGYGYHMPQANEESWSRIIFDLLRVTANACANRQNLKVRERKRGTGSLYRQIFYATERDKSPFVVRNSLANILKFYAPELGELGAKIEDQPDYPRPEKPSKSTEVDPEEMGGKPPDPPSFGDDRGYQGDGTGGAGNIILIHFSRHG